MQNEMEYKIRVLIVREVRFYGRSLDNEVVAGVDVGKVKDKTAFEGNFQMSLSQSLFIRETGCYEKADEDGQPLQYCSVTSLSEYMRKQKLCDLTIGQRLLDGMLRAAEMAEYGTEDSLLAVLYRYYD